MAEWESLEKECSTCRKCDLCSGRNNVVFGVGNRTADIMFVGEGPGEQEDLQGIPLWGLRESCWTICFPSSILTGQTAILPIL